MQNYPNIGAQDIWQISRRNEEYTAQQQTQLVVYTNISMVNSNQKRTGTTDANIWGKL